MKLKYKVKSGIQFAYFAFYPKTTLIACAVFFMVVIVVLAVVMMQVPPDSGIYNVTFALTTGAAASFFVSIIVELSSNYKNNMLAWIELKDYYLVVVDYERSKQVLLGNTASQRAEKKAHSEFVDDVFNTKKVSELTDEVIEELRDIDADSPKDLIESVWEQLQTIIPVLKETFEYKKAFLNKDEIIAINNIIDSYSQIRCEVIDLLMYSPMFYDTLNNPDKEYLDYPTTILDNIPRWLKKSLASNEGEKTLERLADSIMSDKFLLSKFFEDYDISEKGLESYNYYYDEGVDTRDEAVNEPSNFEIDEGLDEKYDFYEPSYPEEHRTYILEMNEKCISENKPFVSWHISMCCLDIAKNMDELEKNNLNKPYYGLILEYNREASLHNLDNTLTDIAYKSEKERLKRLLNE